MALNSKAKGKQGELDLCHTLRELFGWACRRTQQYSGWSRGGTSPDIEIDQAPDLFVECKRVQALNVPRALSIAVSQCGRRCPVVMHRPNRSPNGWMITIRLADLPRLCHAYTHAVDAEAAPCSQVATKTISNPAACDGADERVAPRPARVVRN